MRLATIKMHIQSDGYYLRNQIMPVLLLLEAAKRHLGAGDVLLGVLKIFKLKKQSVT